MRVTPSAVPGLRGKCRAAPIQASTLSPGLVDPAGSTRQRPRQTRRMVTWPAGAGPEDDVTPNMPHRPILTRKRRTRCSRNTRLLKDAPPRRSGESITRRWPGGAAERSYEGLVVDASPMAATTVRPATWAAMDTAKPRRPWTTLWCSRWGAGGAVDGVKQPASRSIPAVDAGLHGQQSAVRPAHGDRPDEKTLDGQASVGDDVTAADLGPDPHAATRLSLNELAGMETASSTASAVHSSMSQPSASANDSLASRSARDWLTLRAARREPIHPPSTGIMAVSAGVGPRGR
jgi:hypothetical protein